MKPAPLFFHQSQNHQGLPYSIVADSPKRRTIGELFHGLHALYHIVVTTKATEDLLESSVLVMRAPFGISPTSRPMTAWPRTSTTPTSLRRHHCAFHVNHKESYQVFNRTSPENIPHGSHPSDFEGMPINSHRHSYGFYFGDLDGDILDLLIRSSIWLV